MQLTRHTHIPPRSTQANASPRRSSCAPQGPKKKKNQALARALLETVRLVLETSETEDDEDESEDMQPPPSQQQQQQSGDQAAEKRMQRTGARPAGGGKCGGGRGLHGLHMPPSSRMEYTCMHVWFIGMHACECGCSMCACKHARGLCAAFARCPCPLGPAQSFYNLPFVCFAPASRRLLLASPATHQQHAHRPCHHSQAKQPRRRPERAGPMRRQGHLAQVGARRSAAATATWRVAPWSGRARGRRTCWGMTRRARTTTRGSRRGGGGCMCGIRMHTCGWAACMSRCVVGGGGVWVCVCGGE